jgi:hypothetical protein
MCLRHLPSHLQTHTMTSIFRAGVDPPSSMNISRTAQSPSDVVKSLGLCFPIDHKGCFSRVAQTTDIKFPWIPL